MNAEEIHSEEIIQIIIHRLKISKKSDYDAVWEPNLHPSIKPDLLITLDGSKERYVIDVANSASLDNLAQLALYQKLLKDSGNTHFVLAAKIISTSVIETAREAGIELVNLPRDIKVGNGYEKARARLTTEKAWNVCLRIIRENGCSIRKISLKENVSYGWAHATVQRLLAAGIARHVGNLVEIHNINKLLDAVAWERPLKGLQVGKFKASFETTYEAAETLTRTSIRWNSDIAFTSYTAASLYAGYGARHDSVYCYIHDKSDFIEFKKNLESKEGITVVFYKPDRPVFDSTQKKEKVRLASPGQTLLDLAGLGYSARDFALELVKKYGDIAADHE